MQQIQFIGTSPEQLQESFTAILKREIESLKKDFQPKTPTEYMTREEVAGLLQVDLSTVWSWTKRKKLLSYRIGNRVLYKRHEVEDAIKPIHNY